MFVKKGCAMAVQNADIAAIFNQMADLQKIGDANVFRVRAYRDAARIIGDLPRPVTRMLAHGEDLAGKIAEIAAPGHLKQLDAVKSL